MAGALHDGGDEFPFGDRRMQEAQIRSRVLDQTAPIQKILCDLDIWADRSRRLFGRRQWQQLWEMHATDRAPGGVLREEAGFDGCCSRCLPCWFAYSGPPRPPTRRRPVSRSLLGCGWYVNSIIAKVGDGTLAVAHQYIAPVQYQQPAKRSDERPGIWRIRCFSAFPVSARTRPAALNPSKRGLRRTH